MSNTLKSENGMRSYIQSSGNAAAAAAKVANEVTKYQRNDFWVNYHVKPVFDWSGGTDVKGQIEGMLKQADFMKAGGGMVQQAFQAVVANQANLSPDQVKAALKPIYAGSISAAIESGQETKYQGMLDYQKMFGGTLDQAATAIANVKKNLQDLPANTQLAINVDVKLNISDADRKLLALIGADFKNWITIGSSGSGSVSSDNNGCKLSLPVP